MAPLREQRTHPVKVVLRYTSTVVVIIYVRMIAVTVVAIICVHLITVTVIASPPACVYRCF